MTALRVHMLHEFDASALSELREQLDPGVELTVGRELPPAPGFDVLVAGRAEPHHLTASPRLRAVVVPWAGIATSLAEQLANHPQVALFNLHHNAQPTAETALALLLAVAKSLGPTDRQMREHAWKERGRDHPSLLLAGRRALIVGHGAIGRRLGEMCAAIGMKVTGVRRTESAGAQAVANLASLLPSADALLICAPLTEETRGLLGAEELALLPRGAIVVNVGRGPVIDETALYEALCSGWLHGAGIDVWWRYPAEGEERTPPSEHPFEDLPNVVMSPHKAGFCDLSDTLRMRCLAAVLNDLAAERDPPGRVDLSRGY